MKDDDFQVILKKAMNLCSKSEKCVDDIKKKNQKWGLNPSDIDKIVTKLKEEGFINHERYAHSFANDKLKFNHWGKKKIAYALKSKSIEENIIEKAIDSIDEDLYSRILNEEISKKHKTLVNKEKKVKKQKLIQYLTQKGFEYGKVFEFVEYKLKK